MTQADVQGHVDFVLVEFSGDRLTGGAGQALLDLVDRGIVAVDVMVLGKSIDGTVYAVDLEGSTGQIGGFGALAWVRSGLLTEEDMQEAAGALEPGKLAVLIVYENTWAVPFVAAARNAGGELSPARASRLPRWWLRWMTRTRGSPPLRRVEESTCHYFAGSRALPWSRGLPAQSAVESSVVSRGSGPHRRPHPIRGTDGATRSRPHLRCLRSGQRPRPPTRSSSSSRSPI
jgi:hypothetical protein